jgi:hypothetical protein
MAKGRGFKPEYLGKLALYLETLNREVRKARHKSSPPSFDGAHYELPRDDRVGHTLGRRYEDNIRRLAFISPHSFFETMHLLHAGGCQCRPASLMTRSGTPTAVATEKFAE